MTYTVEWGPIAKGQPLSVMYEVIEDDKKVLVHGVFARRNR